MGLELLFRDDSFHFSCLGMSGRERLGEAATFDVIAESLEPVNTKKLVGGPCILHLSNSFGGRAIAGVVWSATTALTSQPGAQRKYRLKIRSAFAALELVRRTFVFQKMSVPDIVKKVLTANGYAGDQIVVHVTGTHAPRRYVVQYDETDASFIRRMCEEEGLYFRSESGANAEQFVLEDTSPNATAALHEPLLAQSRDALRTQSMAWDVRESRARRPGKVTLRAYDPVKPAVALEGVAKGGNPVEQEVEIYRGAGRFETPDDGKRLAKTHLESERATATTTAFATNTLMLFAGAKVELDSAGAPTGAAKPNGKYFVFGIDHAWTAKEDLHTTDVHTIPLAVPYRLPLETPRPRALGVHTAIVTGPPGEEIHTDEHGRIFVHFPWDREGPRDHNSSLPIRVMQQSMPGSMIVPRIGWEVWVMFEDGDPDRPYVIGRTYNAAQPPPVSLPKNKTMTAMTTYSSPGGQAKNSIAFDDASGRQHVTFIAAKDKFVTIAHDAHVQTLKVDNHTITGNLSRSVGAEESVTVKQAYLAQMASQSASVGASQHIWVKGNFLGSVKSETISIGAALLEQIGNPVTGATNLATSAALTGAGFIPKVGPYLAAAGGLGLGAYQGYKAGGLKGAAQGLGMGAVGMAANMIPGGDAVFASVQDAAAPSPWKEKEQAAGAEEAGGGAGGATSDASKAQGPGPGHRNTIVKGAMTETIGGSYSVITPGSIGWKTTGLSTITVGGSHMTKTKSFVQNIRGISRETLGAQHIKSDANLSRVVTGDLSTTIAGALKTNSDGPHEIKVADKLTITIGGALKLEGGVVVFVVGDSKVAASDSGVLIEAGDITITDDSKQSSKTTHP
jgi:type VI secretion system secreted protein VgrG